MIEEVDSLLLLHVRTIVHTFLQDSTILHKCVIAHESICKTMVLFRVCF